MKRNSERLHRAASAAVALFVLTLAVVATPQPTRAMSDEDLLYLYYSSYAPEKARADSRFAGRNLAKEFAGFPARDASLVHLAVVRAWDNLKPETREELSKYVTVSEPRNGRREVRQSAGSCELYLGSDEETRSSEHFTVHYTSSSSSQERVDTAGTAGTPSYVEDVLLFSEEVYDHIVDTLGFTAAPTGDGKYDVWLCDLLGHSGNTLLGRTVTDVTYSATSAGSYLELDNNYDNYIQFSDSVENLLKTTVAHEYFHSVQFGLNYYYPSFWIMEATAVWMEPEIYPGIHDWVDLYVKNKRLNNLNLSMDYFSFSDTYGYGNAILFKHITEEYTGSAFMKELWDLVQNDTGACVSGYSYPCDPAYEIREISQIQSALSGYGTTLETAVASMMGACYTKDYVAGSEFSSVPHQATYSSYPASVSGKALDHMGGEFHKFSPVSTSYSQQLTVSFTVNSGTSWSAYLLKHLADGSYERENITISNNSGSLSVYGFGTAITDVVLVAVNTATAESGDGTYSFTAAVANSCVDAYNTSTLSAGWNMVVFPVAPLFSSPGTAITLTASSANLDNGSIVYYDPSAAVAYYGNQTGFQALGKPGQGYWVSIASATALSIQGCVASDDTMDVSLEAGWNMFGTPFRTNVDWDDSGVTVVRGGGTSTHTLSEAVASGWIEPKIYWYTGGAYSSYTHNTGSLLSPWQAYWIKTTEALSLRLKTIQ